MLQVPCLNRFKGVSSKRDYPVVQLVEIAQHLELLVIAGFDVDVNSVLAVNEINRGILGLRIPVILG